MTVTGIHRSAEDISDNPEAMVLLTSAFHDRYGDQIVHCDCSFWIAASRSDADAIAAALPAVIGDYPLAIQEVQEPSANPGGSIRYPWHWRSAHCRLRPSSPRLRRCSSSHRPWPVTSAATDPPPRHSQPSVRHDRKSFAGGR